jgi:nucleoside-diphosphate-sugar epimerase
MINIFGAGFVGGEFAKLCPDAIINQRDDYQIKSDDVVYFISTIDNYNVLTDLHKDIDTNLNLLMTVLESAKDRPNLTFNFISSWFVYGNTELPAKETNYCNPTGFYSITKRAAEQLIISYCETFHIKYRIMRLCNVVGVNDSKFSAKKNAIQYMVNRIKNNESINLYDHGTHIRDYIDVQDVAQAIKLIVDTGAVNEIYNIGNGEPVRIGDIIDYAVKKTGSTSEIIPVEPTHLHNVVQTKHFYADVTKLKALGYERQVPLWESIDRIIKS